MAAHLQLDLKAPAKINLILRVLGRRNDGYHELETWMQKVDLYDRIHVTITEEPGLRLHCTDATIPADNSNLAYRAAHTFFAQSKTVGTCGASIVLEKKIPVAAGLGGGSSDAGTILKGLNSFFKNEFTPQEVLVMARSLGADVPFFATEMNSVLATGIGEKMIPVSPLSNCSILLVNPGVSVSTAWVFENYALTRVDKNSTLTGSTTLSPEELNLSAMENDLEAVTIKHYPVIAEIKDELRYAGADKVMMSGSGPTVFGIFDTSREQRKETIEGAVAKMRSKFGNIVFAVQPRDGV